MAKMAAKDDRAHRARRVFTDEFKAGAVRLVLDEGKTVAEVARDLDLMASALGCCVKRVRADRDGGKSGLATDERAKLRKEVRELKLEREFLQNGRRSSPRKAREVRVHPGGERVREREVNVPSVRCVDLRILRVAQASSVGAREEGRAPQGLV